MVTTMKNDISAMCRRWMVLVALLTINCSLFVSRIVAQDVTVTVTPVQQVLPPQAMLYIANPGNYFNVSVTNNTMTTQNVYLSLQVTHVMPNDGLMVATPPKRMPNQPIQVAPGKTYHLLPTEIRSLFNHIPSNEIMATPGLFDNYSNGSLGLLPEGNYEATMIAYKWDPALAKPVPLSTALTGTCQFTICYKAQAPEFLTPAVYGLSSELSVATLDKQNPQFTWRAPIINCNPGAVNFRYSLKVVELKERQTPDVAINMNAAVLQANEISVPLYIVPANYLGPNRLEEGKTYVAQVTAKASGFGANNLNYTSIENEGKSNLRLFKLGTSQPVIPQVDKPDDKNDKGGKGDDDEEDDEDGYAEAGGSKGDKKEFDSLYVFNQPKFTTPTFDEGTARKLFLGDNMTFEWKRSRYLRGDGERQDTVKMEYEFQLFRGKPGTQKDDVLKGKPVFTKKVKDDTGISIKWEELESADLLINDYMVARVVPKSSNAKSIRFEESTDNILDFAMADHLAAKYFQCSGMVELPNTTPTKKKASDLKGQTVTIGQYQLTIDEITKVDGKDFFRGKGHVEWSPMGFKCMVCVEFDTLFINTDNIVYDGRAKTYPKPEDKGMSDSEVVDKLFSDWGIDNLIGDTQIPYAKEIQDELTSQAKGLAQQVDISKYYTWVKQGKAIYDQFMSGTIDNLYFPLALPKSINKTPVDIQIVSMKFMPTYATMDVLGQFMLPDSKVSKNDVLLLGAPRLCISPDRVLPEAGHIALLGDMTLVEPKSKFEATFKAPTNLLEPEDGCYISWKGDALEVFGIDLDMKIPKLYKEDKQGNRTDENAIFNVKFSLGVDVDENGGKTWDNWVASVTMDPFQVKGLDGFTFKGGSIYYDHSKNRVVGDMQDLPKNYDKELAGMSSPEANIIEWMGLYVRNMSIVMPKGLKMGSFKGDKKGMKVEDDGRLSIECEKLIVDKAGVTANLAINNLIDVSTGKLGGWGFSMDRFYLDILMGQFQDCGFQGQIDVPLLDGNIQYLCDIKNQGVSGEGEEGEWSYTFKTQQVSDLKLDFFIGVADFYKEQTYFELSVKEDKDGNTTSRIELCAGGDISIIGSDKIDGVLAKYKDKLKKYLPFDVSMPRIHFSKLRVGNFDVAESKIMKNIQDSNTGELLSFNDLFGFKSQYEFTGSKTDENGNPNKLYFGPGEWSLTMGSNQSGAHAYLPPGYGRNFDDNLLAASEHGPTPYMQAVDAMNGDVVKGNFGPFSLSLKEYSFKQDGDRMGLYLKGGLNILDDLVWADAGLTIWAKVDLDNFTAEFEKPEFSGASFGCDFAGCHIDGELSIDNGTNKGYSGGLHLKLPGNLIEADVTGGYYENSDNPDDKYSWGWFVIKVGSSAAGIPIPPVQINGIMGGMFFNCTAPIDRLQELANATLKPTAKRYCYGGMFGLTISTIGDENLMKADMKLCAFIEKIQGKYRMSSMLMRGEMNGLSFGGGKGLISGKCTITYANDPSAKDDRDKKYFELNITVDAKADATSLATDFCKSFGVEVPPVGPLKGSAQEMDNASSDNGMKTDGQESEGDNKSSKKDNEESFSASAGASINVNFRVTMKPEGYVGDFDTKWHLYLGNPWEQRCEVVFIDFKTHKNPKKEFISAWAKLTASAYLCIGNELPHDGELPPIPETLKKFLDGPGIGDQKTDASSSKAQSARQGEADKISSMGEVTQGGMKGCRGGVMFGLGSEGDFGVHAGIVYAEGYYTYGLDVILKKLGEGSTCIGGRQAGYHGWYATGQAYAMLQGEVGVHIKLFFIDKTVPLVSVGVGALLQGGLPNPTWIYGKVRAKCKLLGGLITFNQAVEFKAGDVCIPNYGNPLDNIELFASSDPGVDSYKEGWLGEDKVSMFSKPMFTTNYRMGENDVITLVDENAVAQAEMKKGMSREDAEATFTRKYRFLISQVKLECYKSPGTNSPKEKDFIYQQTTTHSTEGSANHQDFKLKGVNLKPNSYYKLVLTGRAEEKRGSTWGAPWYNDEKTGWKDKQDAARATNSKTFYFQTGEASKNFDDYVALSYPHMNDDTFTENQALHRWDMTHPIISFKSKKYLPVDEQTYDYFWNLKIGDEYVDRYVKVKSQSAQQTQTTRKFNWRTARYETETTTIDRYLTWEPERELKVPSYIDPSKVKEVELVRVNKKMSEELQKRWADAQNAKQKMITEMRKDYNNTSSVTWNEALGKYVKTSNLSEYNQDLKKYVTHSGTSSSTSVNQKQNTSATFKAYTYFDENGEKKTGYLSSSSESSFDLDAEMRAFLDKEKQEMVNDESAMREENLITKTGRVTEDYEQRVWSAKFKALYDNNDNYMLASEKWFGTVNDVTFSSSYSNNYYSWDDNDYDKIYKDGYYLYDPYLYMSYLARYAFVGNTRIYDNKYTPDFSPQGLTINFEGGNERSSNQLVTQWMNYYNDIVPHYKDHMPWPGMKHWTANGSYTNNVYPEEGLRLTTQTSNYAVGKALMSDMLSDAATLTVMTKQFKYWFTEFEKGFTFNYFKGSKKKSAIYDNVKKTLFNAYKGVKISLVSSGNYYGWKNNTSYQTFEPTEDGKQVWGVPVSFKFNSYSWDLTQTHILAFLEDKFSSWWTDLEIVNSVNKIEACKENRYHNYTFNTKKSKYEYDKNSKFKQYNYNRLMNSSYIFDAVSWLKSVSKISYLHFRANVYDMANDYYYLRSNEQNNNAFVKYSSVSYPFSSLYY